MRDDIEVGPRADGSLLLRSRLALAPVARSMPALFDQAVARWPGRMFMRQRRADGDGWRSIGYAEAARQSRAIAQWLLDHGFVPGDVVVALSGPSIEHALLTLATQRVRMALAPLSTGYSLLSHDHLKLKACVQRVGARLVFVDDAELYAPAMRALAPLGVRFICVRGEVEGLDCTPYQALVATPPTEAVERETAAITPETIARVMHTSGSTGMPKATPLPQANLTVTVAQIHTVGLLDLGDEQPEFLEAMPFSHIMGGNYNFNNMISVGGLIHLDEGKPTPQLFAQTLRNLQEISPSIYHTVPAGLSMLCDALEADAALRRRFFRKLAYFGCGGASLPQPVRDRLDALSRAERGEALPIYCFYGATEYSLGTVKYWRSPRMDVIGLPLPGTELKLVPFNGRHELRVRAPTLMPRSGYIGDAAASEALFDEEGYFRTGDVVRFDDGALHEGLMFDGRMTEEFKLATGTWVLVGALRLDLLGACAPLVREVVLCGRDQPFVGALLWLDDTAARQVAGEAGGEQRTPRQLGHDPQVVAAVRAAIDRFNVANPGGSRRIRRALIVSEPLSAARGELTDKGTVNQRLTVATRSDDVARLFQPQPDAHRLEWTDAAASGDHA